MRRVLPREGWGVRVVLIALACGLAASGVLWTRQHTGVYMSEVDLVLLPPQGEEPSNALTNPSRGFVDFAGIVAKSVMGASSAPTPVSEQVTLVGMGISDGWVVRQPNDGGQWNMSFSRPLLNVQATGPTPDRALATLNEAVAKVRAKINDWEDVYSVAARNRVAVTLNPAIPAVYYYNGDGNRASLGIVGLWLLAVIWLLASGRHAPRGAPRGVRRPPRVRAPSREPVRESV